jgi:amino acid transporter
MAFDIGGYKYSGPMASSQLSKKLGTIPSLPATSAAAIMSANPSATDGFYYIKFGTFGVKGCIV